jgi:Transposase DDE domain
MGAGRCPTTTRGRPACRSERTRTAGITSRSSGTRSRTGRRTTDASLRQRGSLTVWFSDEAIAAWRAAPRTTRGGQPSYSALAVTTALTLRAVLRLALRQTEGLIGSILHLLGLDLAVPDHTTLSRRAETLAVPRPASGPSGEPVHLLVDSTGLKLCGPGEWLVEKHGTRTRRGWRKPHLTTDADTGRIVAAELTGHDADDGSRVGPLLDQIGGPVAALTADGAFDRDDVYAQVAARYPDAEVIVPPRSGAVPSDTAATAPTQRDRHIWAIAERGRRGWQKASGYNWRALVEADIARWKRVIGDGLRSRTDRRQATEVAIAADVLNRLLDLGRPKYVRLA